MTTGKGSKGSKGSSDGADQAASDGHGNGTALGDHGAARSRRGFLAGAGAAAGIAGAAAVALKSRGQPVLAEVDPQSVVEATGKSRGYHETAHIRKYYDTTKV